MIKIKGLLHSNCKKKSSASYRNVFVNDPNMSSQLLQTLEFDTILREPNGLLTELPPELLLPHIFARLGLTELLNTGMTCKFLFILCSDDYLWKKIYSHTYRLLDLKLEESERALQYYDLWKSLYICRELVRAPLKDVHLESDNKEFLDKYALEIQANGLTATKPTPSYGDYDVGVVRGSRHLSPYPGLPGGRSVGYFEIGVINSGPKRSLSMGLAAKNYPAHHIGWYQGSFGYHADDGNKFTNDCDSIYSCVGKNYNQGYGAGDVVGCGFNFTTNEIFFTRNGEFLGVAFTLKKNEAAKLKDAEGNLALYPSVALREEKQTVIFNFGKSKFAFHIDAYILGMKVTEGVAVDHHPREFNTSRILNFSSLKIKTKVK